MNIVEARNISREYHEGSVRVLAVDSVSLTLKKGEAVLIMGPSGSGKTTLLSMLGCILHPTAGEVTVDGRAVTALGEEMLPEIRKRYFGFVFQSFNLFPSLTAAENVEAILRFKGCNKNSAAAEALHLLEGVNLAHRKDFYPGDLSGGEKQRVAFARALVHEPQVLICDEPTAALDTETGTRVMELMRQRALAPDRCLIVVTHDNRIVPYADRIAYLVDGRITEIKKGEKDKT